MLVTAQHDEVGQRAAAPAPPTGGIGEAMRVLRRSLHRWRPARGFGAWQIAVIVVCLLAGALLGTARAYSGGHEIRNRSTDLSVLVADAEQRVHALKVSAADLQGQINQAAGQDVSPQVARAREQADALRPAAGLTPVHGPALRVTLTDAPRDADGNYPAGVDPDNLVVHQQDVQSVVNALWAGGAEAMTIMDQRVVATSAVRCIGNTLLLQGRTYSPPFVVTAIGDADAMTDAVRAEPGVALFLQYAKHYGLGFTMQRLDDVTFPGYDGVVRMTAATKEPR
jgi:uncharacterized protein YlxW (UPF0749 family)